MKGKLAMIKKISKVVLVLNNCFYKSKPSAKLSHGRLTIGTLNSASRLTAGGSGMWSESSGGERQRCQ